MCGIFGFADWRGGLPPSDRLARATNLLHHRGPDGAGTWTEHGVFLGHRRLAIIDLATGDQPMRDASDRFVITFNGEIYNYPELRDELRAHGAIFQTSSDTEVILEGYRVWGTGVVARLEGMFAFAIYDRREQTLLLARDRFGEKPLLVARTPGRLIFASELAPLAAVVGGAREIDLEALGGYLCLNYVPGTRTMMRGVERVAAATWQLHGASGLIRQEQYWNCATAGRASVPSDPEALLDLLQARIDDAVRLTLRSDVPVGLFLSGGTDSALVAQSAARQGKLEAAFCVDMVDAGFSEFSGATHVAEAIGVELVRVPLDASVLDSFLDVASHLDDPLADSSAMAVWSVSRAASQRMKVVLSGDGGDELFGGYLTYPATRWHARVSPWLPTSLWSAAARASARIRVNDAIKVGADYKLQRLLRAMPLPTREAHFTWNGTWTPLEAASLVRTELAREAAASALTRLADAHALPARPSTHDLQLADLREYLPNDILAKVDRATMAHGLESRAPLLNSGVADLALALPPHLRATATGRTKVLLRRLCARHFGEAHATAPKQGFSIPIHRWLRTTGRPILTQLLARERVAALDVLDPAAVSRAVEAHLSGRRALGWELWGLMVLVAWHEHRVASVPQLAA
jgi:asparagine synthase (glutamine-hydrolysing)